MTFFPGRRQDSALFESNLTTLHLYIVDKLKITNFLALRGSEAVLTTYVRYIDEGHFAEEMFCKRLESTTPSKDHNLTFISIFNSLFSSTTLYKS